MPSEESGDLMQKALDSSKALVEHIYKRRRPKPPPFWIHWFWAIFFRIIIMILDLLFYFFTFEKVPWDDDNFVFLKGIENDAKEAYQTKEM